MTLINRSPLARRSRVPTVEFRPLKVGVYAPQPQAQVRQQQPALISQPALPQRSVALKRPLRLTELSPQFLRLVDKTNHRHVDTLAEAQGVLFLCPLCFQENGNSNIGVHSVICWSYSRGVPDDVRPGPGRWKLDGSGYADLALNTDPPKSNSRSVLLTGDGCGWHGFITNGEVT